MIIPLPRVARNSILVLMILLMLALPGTVSAQEDGEPPFEPTHEAGGILEEDHATIFAHARHPTEDWILVAYRDGYLARWSPDTNVTEWFPVRLETGVPRGADWHPSGEYALITSREFVAKFTPPDKVEYLDRPDERYILSASFSPDGSEALLPGFQGMFHYDHASGRLTDISWEGGDWFGYQAAWHPSGSHALVVGSGVMFSVDVKILRWQNGQWFIAHRTEGWEAPSSVAYHPDGDFALIGGCRLTRIPLSCESARAWAYHPGLPLEALPLYTAEDGGPQTVNSVSFSPEGVGYAVSLKGAQGTRAGELQLHRSTNGLSFDPVGPAVSGYYRFWGSYGRYGIGVMTGWNGTYMLYGPDGFTETLIPDQVTPSLYLKVPERSDPGKNATIRVFTHDTEGMDMTVFLLLQGLGVNGTDIQIPVVNGTVEMPDLSNGTSLVMGEMVAIDGLGGTTTITVGIDFLSRAGSRSFGVMLLVALVVIGGVLVRRRSWIR